MPNPMRRREFLSRSGRAALGLSVLPLVACSRGIPEPVELRDRDRWAALIADLEQQIPRLMEEARVPGLAIAIVQDARLVWRRGFGVRNGASQDPVDNDTVFEAASTSKPVFAYAVMKLAEKGVLDLDTPLTVYTSDRFLEGDPRLDLITARHVLSHTSGFPNWRSRAEPLSLHFTPGERWSYSGEGYGYLQSVVTQLLGGRVNSTDCASFEAGFRVCAMEPSIDEYMKANLLVPFGMTSSGYLWDDAMEDHVARGHDEEGLPFDDRRKPTGPSVARYGMAGGLFTTPTDHARFLLEVIDPKPTDAFRLSQESLREMLHPHVETNSGSAWALGWEIDHTETGDFIRHGGGNPGHSCLIAASVERRSGVAIMTNSDNGYYGVIAKLIAGESLSRLLGGRLRASAS